MREWATFTRRTNFPKLGYIIFRLAEKGIGCRFNGESWHAPILEVDKGWLAEANAILDERIGRYRLDDVRDDHPRFNQFAKELPSYPAAER